MVATVRLNSELAEILNPISTRFHKKRSDIIREAIRHYAKEMDTTQKSRMQKAMQKTMKSDFKEYKDLEESLADGL